LKLRRSYENSKLLLTVSIVCISIVLAFASAALAGGAKVEVCHIPPDDPDNYHTIKVGVKAAQAHLGHGDLLKPCDTHAEIVCNDNDACTIDAFNKNGVCNNSEEVQCDNPENLCQVNHRCHPVDGCLYDEVICNASDPCIAASICDPNDGECVTTDATCAENEVCEPGIGCVQPTTDAGLLLGFEFIIGNVIGLIFINVETPWLTDPTWFLDVNIRGLNGGPAFHGMQRLAVVDGEVFPSPEVFPEVTFIWTADEVGRVVNEVYTTCIQVIHIVNGQEMFVGDEKCLSAGPF